MSWANWASGAAGSGMRWPYPNYGFEDGKYLNPLSENMIRSLAALAKVSSFLDWNTFAPRQVKDELKSANQDVMTFAVSDKNSMAAWLLRSLKSSQKNGATNLQFSGFEARDYEAFFFDDSTGDLLRREKARGPAFKIDSPSFEKHLALVVRPFPA